jgi:hypothetical protein
MQMTILQMLENDRTAAIATMPNHGGYPTTYAILPPPLNNSQMPFSSQFPPAYQNPLVYYQNPMAFARQVPAASSVATSIDGGEDLQARMRSSVTPFSGRHLLMLFELCGN